VSAPRPVAICLMLPRTKANFSISLFPPPESFLPQFASGFFAALGRLQFCVPRLSLMRMANDLPRLDNGSCVPAPLQHAAASGAAACEFGQSLSMPIWEVHIDGGRDVFRIGPIIMAGSETHRPSPTPTVRGPVMPFFFMRQVVRAVNDGDLKHPFSADCGAKYGFLARRHA